MRPGLLIAMALLAFTASGQPFLPRVAKRPAATNWCEGFGWNPVTNATGYLLHATNASGASNCWNALGATNYTARFPVPVCRWWLWATAYDTNGLESQPSNVVHVPGDEVIQVSGEELVAYTSLSHPDKRFTNSPWMATNVTGCQFFESADGAGPSISLRMFYGY